MKAGLCADMPLLVEDWLISPTIASMSPAEEGGYIRLLCYAWRDPDCCLPIDGERLANLSRLGIDGWKTSGPKILQNFQPDPDRPGLIFNAKQRELRGEQLARVNAVRGQRQAAAKARWNGSSGRNATAMRTAMQPESARNASTLSTLTAHSTHSTPPEGDHGHPETNVELPAGFPKSESEAKAHAGFVGCTEDFAVKVWNLAMSRGGRDSKDIPIRNFRSHLATAASYEKDFQARAKKQQQQGIRPQLDPNDWRNSL